MSNDGPTGSSVQGNGRGEEGIGWDENAPGMRIKASENIKDLDLSRLRFLPELIKDICRKKGDLASHQEFVQADRDFIQPIPL